MRTAMWSALQATILFAQDPELAAGEHMPEDDSATSGSKPEMSEPKVEEELKCEPLNEADAWSVVDPEDEDENNFRRWFRLFLNLFTR